MTIPTSIWQGAVVRTPARFSLTTLALAAALTQTAIAQEQKVAETVVTATRTEALLESVLSDVTVITREQIEAFAPSRSVVEVLQRLAGVQINSNGGRGQTQSVFIRGSESRHTLLLIDGARHGSASGGSPSFANLPLEQIERIEVVKGPASALYGSEAIGGVIQIFTKRARQDLTKPLTASGSLTIGKHDHKSTDLHLSGAQAGFDYQLGLARTLDKGFSVIKPNAFVLDADNDGFDQTSWNLGLGYNFNKDWRVEASLLRTEGTANYDSDFQESLPFVDMSTDVSRIALLGQISPHWKTTLSLSESIDQSENLNRVNTDRSFKETKQTELKWDHNIETAVGTAILGIERLEQEIETQTAVPTPKKRAINAIFSGVHGTHQKHYWQASVRRDNNSQFGGYTTYGLNYGYELLQGLRAYAAHGRSMRAPSFDDLYSPSFGSSYPGYAGNPSLQPEKGKNVEIGLNYQSGFHRAKLVRYDNKVSNLITRGVSNDFQRNAPGVTRLQGWTAEYGMSHGNWDLSATYNKLKARHADGSTPLLRAPSHISLNLSHRMNAWTFGASAQHVAKRIAYGGKSLDAYATLDLFTAYQISDALAIQARIANATNRDYMLSDGYNQLGRAGYLTLKWAPK